MLYSYRQKLTLSPGTKNYYLGRYENVTLATIMHCLNATANLGKSLGVLQKSLASHSSNGCINNLGEISYFTVGNSFSGNFFVIIQITLSCHDLNFSPFSVTRN